MTPATHTIYSPHLNALAPALPPPLSLAPPLLAIPPTHTHPPTLTHMPLPTQSCMKPATDIFISASQMVASIVVLPLVYGNQTLGGLYFVLDTPSNFQVGCLWLVACGLTRAIA